MCSEYTIAPVFYVWRKSRHFEAGQQVVLGPFLERINNWFYLTDTGVEYRQDAIAEVGGTVWQIFNIFVDKTWQWDKKMDQELYFKIYPFISQPCSSVGGLYCYRNDPGFCEQGCPLYFCRSLRLFWGADCCQHAVDQNNSNQRAPTKTPLVAPGQYSQRSGQLSQRS